jgi:hypothetical protein
VLGHSAKDRRADLCAPGRWPPSHRRDTDDDLGGKPKGPLTNPSPATARAVDEPGQPLTQGRPPDRCQSPQAHCYAPVPLKCAEESGRTTGSGEHPWEHTGHHFLPGALVVPCKPLVVEPGGIEPATSCLQGGGGRFRLWAGVIAASRAASRGERSVANAVAVAGRAATSAIVCDISAPGTPATR